VGDEIRAPDTLVEAIFHATADAGSIPAVSTFAKNSNRPPRQRGAIRLGPATQRVDLVAQRVDTPLGLDKRLRQRLATASLADEVDEVGQSSLLGAQLGLLELQRAREVGAQLGDLLLDAPQDVGDMRGVGKRPA
jgi:hypothetical protein